MPRFLTLLLAVSVLAGCGGGDQDNAKIRTVIADYTNAWATRDTKTLCSLITPQTVAAFAAKNKSCPEYMTAQLATKTDQEVAMVRRIRINKVFLQNADHALVQFTGGNGQNRLVKVKGRWLIDGLATN